MNKKISTRTAYGEALAEIGSDPRIFVLDADLQCCTRTEKFGALYPERSRNVGIAPDQQDAPCCGAEVDRT